MSKPLQDLSDAGVAIWLDDLSRELIQSGELARLIAEKNVVGVTTNPTIFAGALSNGEAYNDQVLQLATDSADVDAAVFALTTQDVRAACDVLRPVYDATGGVNGRVSIEVDPRLAHDEAGTVASARALWAAVDRPNAMIKIPATLEGLPAITTVLSEGISVNVTLIFALERYRAVLDAWLAGLESARAKGLDVARIESVASFFVSRVDTEVDSRLAAIDDPAAAELRSKAGIANARLAYQAFEDVIGAARWQALAADGAHVQRPLWASTGVKDPALPDTLYVTELVAPDTVNTMPRKTLEAVGDHGVITGDRVRANYADAQGVLDRLAAVGVDFDDVVALLETQGVSKFEASWSELLGTVQDELARAATFAEDSVEREL